MFSFKVFSLLLALSVTIISADLNQLETLSNNLIDSTDSFTAYAAWWESIVGGGKPKEPDTPVIPVVVKSCPTCKCGHARVSRIVGGHNVKYVNQYAWMCQLMYKNKFYCGGSLINDRYVLTAAHCVHNFDKKHISVKLLEHDTKSEVQSKRLIVDIDKIIKHKSYSGATFNNDIALIRLKNPIKLGDEVNTPTPICLPPEGKSFNGDNGLVVGWGATKMGGSVSSVVQEVSVPIMSNDQCKKTGYGQKRITANMMCAGRVEGGIDSCQGDSGGPMKVANNATNCYHVVGIVSWGEGCAVKNYPGVYTRVNRYLNWINSNTQDACPCPHVAT